MDLNKLFAERPFSLSSQEKAAFFDGEMKELTQFHYENCTQYRKILNALDFDAYGGFSRLDVPFLPVRLFKDYDLLSVPKETIVKTMTSSGTSGQRVSKIYLDKDTAAMQTRVLAKITSDFLGNKRLPMLVIDSSAIIKDRNLFSARGAGLLGFSMLGRDITYALDENMNLDEKAVCGFLDKYSGEPTFLFGFTFMIWEHFYKEIVARNLKFDLSKAILLHGGGFKKLIDQAVSNEEFKLRLKQATKITNVYNYYGMVEQTGSIYMECECGNLHCSDFSDIIVRRHEDFGVCKIGEKGLIQLQSLIPKSYPGYNLLSEDEGVITGEDNCKCGRKGKTFKILGRIKSAEVRGCSDTYEKK